MRDICLFSVTNAKRGRVLSCSCYMQTETQHKCKLSQGPVAPAGPRTLSPHSPIGSSVLTAYELLIGSGTGQDCHLQLTARPERAFPASRRQAGSGSARPHAPYFSTQRMMYLGSYKQQKWTRRRSTFRPKAAPSPPPSPPRPGSSNSKLN